MWILNGSMLSLTSFVKMNKVNLWISKDPVITYVVSNFGNYGGKNCTKNFHKNVIWHEKEILFRGSWNEEFLRSFSRQEGSMLFNATWEEVPTY